MFNKEQLGTIEVDLDVCSISKDGAWHAYTDQCIHIEFSQQSNQTKEDLEMLRLLNGNPELLQLDKVAGFKTKSKPQ